MTALYNLKFILTLFLLFMIYSCTLKKGKVIVQLDEQKGLLSVKANSAKISSILDEIDLQTGLLVFVPDLVDSTISLKIDNTPIYKALVEMLGEDTRFHIDMTKNELLIQGNKGPKKGKKEIKDRPKISKKEPDSKIDPTPEGRNVKMKPDEVKLITSDGTNRSKNNPEKSLEIPEIKYKKEKRDESKQDEKHFRLRFEISGDAVKLLKIITLSGELSIQSYPARAYVYSIEENGQFLFSGSFENPLSKHTYFPETDREHEIIRERKGYFDIDVPDILDQKRLSQLKIHFFRGGDQISEKSISTKSFTKVQNELKEFAIVNLEEYSKLLENQ